jgi:uncharacterized protein (DUF2384 family)
MNAEQRNNRLWAERVAARVKLVMDDLLEFYEPNEAMLWFMSHQALLDRDVPFLLLQTTAGFKRVRAVIARLQDGAFI